MANFQARPGSQTDGEHRLARMILLLYLAFILYGSFFPFHFAAGHDALLDRLGAAVMRPWDSHGQRIFSIPDLISNILLGAPFGVLLIIGRLVGTSLTGQIIRIMVLDVLLAGSIEVGQLFAPGRTTSILDVGGQVTGSIGGGIVGQVLLRSFEGSLGPWILGQLRRRPALGPLVLLVGILAADALYPYAVTLDISNLRGSAKAAAWVPLSHPLRLPWHAIIVEGVLPYTLLAALLCAELGPGRVAGSRMHAFVLGTALAVGLELGKLFIEGRAPNADHVLVAAVGLLAGVVGLPAVDRLRRSPLRAWVFVVATTGLMIYEELAPFGLVWSSSHLQARAARIEWAPFAAYYWADPQSALFDAGKKFLLGGLFGSTLWAAGRPRVLSITLLVGGLLEAAQLLTTSRHPSVTDVLLLATGAAAGRTVYRRYHLMVCSCPGREPGMLDSRQNYNGHGTQPRDDRSA